MTYISQVSKCLVGWGQAARATANIKGNQDGEDMLSSDCECVSTGVCSEVADNTLNHQLDLRAAKVVFRVLVPAEIIFTDNYAPPTHVELSPHDAEMGTITHGQ